eukprot:CAMPEP_0185764686 /NCGR_PEP_ID=MMETSP1174-20130828/23662_1 /TAXON_ID=35687 /ORGANISM="Dictyocha speculum, Strain CCMP1381" /LENGTH=312 /DNA_ID=CAMNT_0028447341 /DNA_START=31 /DNA_END=969 /DNA_ORIENTATION=+
MRRQEETFLSVLRRIQLQFKATPVKVLGCTKGREMACGVKVLTPDAGVRRAAVSVVLRLNENAATELLLIRRADNPQDKWSGDIALPGGKREAGESDLEAAVRETREEVGLDVIGGGFDLLGQLDDRMINSGGKKKKMVISVFIFGQRDGHPRPTLKIQPGEVASAWWAPFEELEATPVTELSKPFRKFMRLPFPADTLVRDVLRCDQIFFSCLAVNPPSKVTKPEEREKFIMWGITLRVFSDLVHRVRGRQLLPGRTYRLGSKAADFVWFRILAPGGASFATCSHRHIVYSVGAVAVAIGLLQLGSSGFWR